MLSSDFIKQSIGMPLHASGIQQPAGAVGGLLTEIAAGSKVRSHNVRVHGEAEEGHGRATCVFAFVSHTRERRT